MNSPCVNCGADFRVCKECDWYNGVWISKDQYEAKLKADMIDMLEEIKDLANDECWDFDRELDITLSKEVVNLDVIENIIQQKINKLKEDEKWQKRTLMKK